MPEQNGLVALAVCWSRWWSLSVKIIGFSSPSKRHGAKVAVEDPFPTC
ncbi:hypothetical protein KCP78_20490 [Salmonella enterica subsp. enterica]|nr:hypothetical protein KCP78_20490 [Salmonella enterica subsp. enterica]